MHDYVVETRLGTVLISFMIIMRTHSLVGIYRAFSNLVPAHALYKEKISSYELSLCV